MCFKVFGFASQVRLIYCHIILVFTVVHARLHAPSLPSSGYAIVSAALDMQALRQTGLYVVSGYIDLSSGLRFQHRE